MEMNKLNGLSDEALVHRELQLERDLIQATFLLKTDQLEDSSQLSKLRKDIARARTLQRRREVEQGLRKNALRDRYRGAFKPGKSAEETAAPAGTAGFLKGIASKLGIGKGEEAGE